jgi:hypothetical protein
MERTTVSTADRGSIRIGCSGWVYKHWRGFFYPEGLAQKRWFQHYAADPQAAPDAASLRAMAAAGAGFFVAKPYSPTPKGGDLRQDSTSAKARTAVAGSSLPHTA